MKWRLATLSLLVLTLLLLGVAALRGWLPTFSHQVFDDSFNGNGVELGANAILIGDITIGHHVTVGAGSVVMDSVPDNALVTGEKARVKVIK